MLAQLRNCRVNQGSQAGEAEGLNPRGVAASGDGGWRARG